VLEDGLGAAGSVLARADVAILNLESVVADNRSGLRRQPKQFTFVAPGGFLDVLSRNGVDAVTVANNHGMDYGRAGLRQTLASARQTRPALLGAGSDEARAFTPWRSEVKGRGIVVFGATDVLDDGFDWAATPERAGLASIKTQKGYQRLRTAVRDARKAHADDVIVVYLHAGVERRVCPTDRQRRLGGDLAEDGADAVAMSHAHVLQPFEVKGDTAVAYGLGNFVFAARSQGTSTTGVLELEFPAHGPPVPTWHPATIEAGVPALVPDEDKAAAIRAWERLGEGC